MRFGYVRISEQDASYYLDLQKKKMVQLGVLADNIYEDILDAIDGEHSNLNRCISMLKAGDQLVLYSIDRLGKTFNELAKILYGFKVRGIELLIFDGGGLRIDTKDKACLLYEYISMLAENEKVVVANKMKPLEIVTRSMDDNLGRPPKVSIKALQEISYKMKNREVSVEAICTPYNLLPKDIYKYIYQTGEFRPEGVTFLEKYSKSR